MLKRTLYLTFMLILVTSMLAGCAPAPPPRLPKRLR